MELKEELTHIKTTPTIIASWMRELTLWQAAYPFSQITRRLEENYVACNKQTLVGWDRFWEGWLVSDWLEIQREYLRELESPRSAETWMVHAIRRIWKVDSKMWKLRCDHVHAFDKRDADVLDKAMINVGICKEYALGKAGVDPRVAHLLTASKEQTLQQDLVYKRYWLTTLQSGRSEI